MNELNAENRSSASVRNAEFAAPSSWAARQAQLALAILAEVQAGVENETPADLTLARIYRQRSGYGARDRRFYSQLVYAYWRWYGWLKGVTDPERRAVYSWLLDSSERPPAIAWLIQKLGIIDSGLSVDTFAAQKRLAQELTGQEVSPADLFPAWVKDSLAYPSSDESEREAHWQNFLESAQKRPLLWLRTRPEDGEKLANYLISCGLKVHQPWPGSLGVNKAINNAEVRQKTGVSFEIQDISSQCVGLVCRPKSQDHWWDCCSGSGGKSLHLAALLGNRGKVLATDIRPTILNSARQRAQEASAKCVQVAHFNDQRASSWDGVLLDAPCSGLGTWARNADARWRCPESKITELAALQRQLLGEVADAVRPGGTLVYAVCTLTAAETTENIRSFLAQRPDFALEPTTHPLTGGVTDGQIWLWPWQSFGNGMFIARLQRVG